MAKKKEQVEESVSVRLIRDPSLCDHYVECDSEVVVPTEQVQNWLDAGNGWKIFEE